MKKLILSISVVLMGTLFFGACEIHEQFNSEPLDEISDQTLWKDPALIEANINDIYLGMGHGHQGTMLAALSDEAHFIHGYGANEVVQSTIGPSNRGIYDHARFRHFHWDYIYSYIRNVNTFFSEIGEADLGDQEIIDRSTGEAHFLRAYFYHNLLRIYGGVPIITEVFGLDAEIDQLQTPRNSFEETVNFIVDEAEAAADLLPPIQVGNNLGRASASAALALKSRVLLYAASDLYHENPSGNNYTGYISGQNRNDFWQEAKDAAEDVMNMGYHYLFRANPAAGDSIALNYYELFLQKDNPEAILSRFFLKSRGDGYNPGLQNGPNGYHNWAGNTPIQQLVDDYQMEDGSEFDWSNPEHAAAPYENRDPRFYASILYDGAKWRPRPSDVTDIDPFGIIQTFTELETPNGTFAGVDTRDSPIEDWNGSFSGYYLRKFIDENVNHSTENKQEVPWIFFRYAEILLNYAEASIELGDYADARDALNQIRRRAGMPEYTTETGEELKAEYRNERRIEMAYEEQRYFDIRRWMIAPEVMDEDAAGIDIWVKGDNRADRNTYYDYVYEVNESIQNRFWDNKMYFAPISHDEMNRNIQLEQNPGY